MSENVNCWRCERSNSVAVSNCEGCGVESPANRPNSTPRRVAGSSASESAWEDYAKRSVPTLSRSEDERNRGLASYLEKRSSLAITYLRVSAFAALSVWFFVFLSTVLTTINSYEMDAGEKILNILTMLGFGAGLVITTFFLDTFFTYIKLRAKEFQNR